MIDIRRLFSPVILRAGAYAVLLALITIGTMLLPGDSFCEGHAVEWLQFFFLVLSAGAFILAGSKNKAYRALSLSLAAFFTIAGIRECDRFFDHLICEDFWKIAVTAVVIPAFVYMLKNFKAIISTMTTVTHRNGFGMLLSGFLVLLFSRLFGHNDYWSDLLGKTNQKLILRVIEENTELLAYFVFLAGAVEYALRVISLKSSETDTQSG